MVRHLLRNCLFFGTPGSYSTGPHDKKGVRADNFLLDCGLGYSSSWLFVDTLTSRTVRQVFHHIGELKGPFVYFWSDVSLKLHSYACTSSDSVFEHRK